MTRTEAIRRADLLRPNALEETWKQARLTELEGRLAGDTEGGSLPYAEDLLVGPPCEGVYERYLCAMIDLAQQDTALYADDIALFNQTYDETRALGRRQSRPSGRGIWRVL